MQFYIYCCFQGKPYTHTPTRIDVIFYNPISAMILKVGRGKGKLNQIVLFFPDVSEHAFGGMAARVWQFSDSKRKNNATAMNWSSNIVFAALPSIIHPSRWWALIVVSGKWNVSVSSTNVLGNTSLRYHEHRHESRQSHTPLMA